MAFSASYLRKTVLPVAIAAKIPYVLLVALVFIFYCINVAGTSRGCRYCPIFTTIDAIIGVFLVLALVYYGVMCSVVLYSIYSKSSYSSFISLPMKKGSGTSEESDDGNSKEDKEAEDDSGKMSGMEKKARKVHKWVHPPLLCCVIFMGLLVFLFFGLYAFMRANTIPDLDGTVEVQGLEDVVSIFRDAEGMLHVKAKTDLDMFFGMGWATAQERLWQLDFQRRIGKGTLSAVLGNATIQVDRYLRSLGIPKASKELVDGSPPEYKAIYDAYVNGINKYIDGNHHLPIEFYLLGYRPDPFEPADIFSWGKMLSFATSKNMGSEITRWEMLAKGVSLERIDELFIPYGTVPLNSNDVTAVKLEDMENQLNFTYVPNKKRNSESLADSLREFYARKFQDVPSSGKENPSVPKTDRLNSILQSLGIGNDLQQFSNGWALSGSRTVSGKPIQCNDPHEPFQTPPQWLVFHLESPSYNTIGITIPLIPTVIAGRNERISWGITNAGLDVQDLFIIADQQDGTYIHNGTVHQFITREETIENGDFTETIIVRETLYGPVISDFYPDGIEGITPDSPLSLQWPSLSPGDTTLEGFLDIMKAEDFPSWRQALRSVKGPLIAYTYADIDGNIAFMSPGSAPIRNGHDGFIPVPGNGDYDWIDFIPFEEMPQVLNPASGYIVTANQKTMPQEYPYQDYITRDWSYGTRAARITEMIEAKPKHSFEDMIAIQLDQTTILHRDCIPILESLQGLSTEESEWRDKVVQWDGILVPESKEGTVFETWWIYIEQLPALEFDGIIDPPIPTRGSYLLNALRNNSEADCTARGTTCLEFAADSFHKAMELWNGNPPEYHDWHKAAFKHPALSGVGPIGCMYDRIIPFGGSDHTVNAGPFTVNDLEEFEEERAAFMGNGPSYRHCVDFSDLESSVFIFPIGQSDSPFRSTFDNLIDYWKNGEYLPMQLNEEKKEAHSIILQPKA